jgi:hypothetical protein
MDPTLSLEVLAFLGASLVALVHLFIARIRVLDRDGAIWLDVLAGVALGYVFVDLMPHLAGMQEKLLEAGDEGLLGFLEHHACQSKGRKRGDRPRDPALVDEARHRLQRRQPRSLFVHHR